ncbi:hypothetical protein [Vreelandella salicampi]|uniref:Uncharacterized protein n=1 Tax=Vreelandella salicampi TaxID=1449798 RepID=A0A7Z0LMT6_9GAMM|nr:hypothetical protein [Halomonas salicampi]NYS61768.1 hypothetical protein [Halomonas salicampi]
MQANGFFQGIGEAVGEAIHAVVTFLLSVFTNFFDAFEAFIDGLARSLGISPSFFSILVLVMGLWILWGGLRALFRGALIGGIVRTVLGLFVLGWLLM